MNLVNKLTTLCGAVCLSMSAMATDFSNIEKIINDTKAAANLPSGTAIAVVKDDKIIYEGYFGYADIANKTPITKDTSFYIASTTKPYFALAMLLKEHRGELSQDTSLDKLFPKMKFSDFDASKVTVRHLLGHTMGIDNVPLVMATAYTGNHDAAKRNQLVANSYPNKEAPLDTFDYSNVGYNILSVWFDNTHQQSWQQMVNQSVLSPLQAHHSSTVISDANKTGWSLALPYSIYSKTDTPLYLQKRDNTMHSAGGMISSVRDMANFVKVQLNNGKLNGQQVFPASVIEKSQQNIAKANMSRGDYNRTGYAWGWFTGPYLDESLYHHFGGYAGTHSHLSFMPEHNIGVVILNNDDMLGSRLTAVVAKTIYATLLNKPEALAQASSEAEKLQQKIAQLPKIIAKMEQKLAARKWQLSLPRASYTGTFNHSDYGDLVVTTKADDKFEVALGQMRAIATPYKNKDSLRVELIPNRGEPITFTVENNKADSLKYNGTVFKRVR